PLVTRELDARVHARHLRVPVERDVVAGAAADRHAGAPVEQHDHLAVARLAVEEDRRSRPLRVDALPQLLRGGDVAVERGVRHSGSVARPRTHQGWETPPPEGIPAPPFAGW